MNAKLSSYLKFQLSITPPPHKPYIHQPIPSKGIGLIATRQLLKETEILIDTSLFSVTLTGDQQTDALSVGTKLKSLPKESQLKFFALNNVFLKESGPFIGVMRTNSFQHNENWHILPTISRMNHSCKPNCDGVWSSTITQQIGGVTTFKLLVRKDIRKGEELTITYVYPSLSREEKREELKREFGFDCACKECKPVVLSSEGRNINARMSNAWQSLTKINERLNEKGT